MIWLNPAVQIPGALNGQGRGGGGVDTEARINSSEHKVLQLLPADTPPFWKVEADSVPILS